ncbi:carbohydrate-binding family 9-like protein [Paenibacillus sp. CGMCC 1.16610]|nr:carbohydrate-binding family 9-like protein [Paenibacillus sp. CGMCC 1.16610]
MERPFGRREVMKGVSVVEEKLPLYICEHADFACSPLDDLVWDRLLAIRLRDIVTGGQPRLSTAVKVCWNRLREAIYFRFTCDDDHVIATMTNHDDSLYEEDVVEVFICDTGKFSEYKEFEVSPANVKFDAIIQYDLDRPPIQVVREWHAIDWKTVTRVSESGYVSIWELPLRNFSVGTPSVGDIWRINFFRIDRGGGQPDEFSAWSPVGTMQFHTPEKFGFLQFA